MCVCVFSRQMDAFITYEDDDSKATKKQNSKHDQAVSNLFVRAQCPSSGRSVSKEHDSRATRRNNTENKTEQFHNSFGQRGGSSRKGLNPLDEIVICVFETKEGMIR